MLESPGPAAPLDQARDEAESESFFHLRTPAGTAWPAVPDPRAAQVWAAYRELDRTQWLARDRIEALQLSQIRALLAHCAREVPYYRDVLARAGLAGRPISSLEELRSIPLLTRELYQANYANLQARNLPAGMTATSSAYTSGTSGVPIQVRKTSNDGLWWHALYLRDLEWGRIDPRGRIAAIRLVAMDRKDLPMALKGGSAPSWNALCGVLLESGPAYGMDVRQDPRRQLEWLREVQPDYLVSFPTNLEHLAGLVLESGQPLATLRAIQAVGEPLVPVARERIEAAFGAPVKNLYSTTEGGYMASSCPEGHGLHVHSEGVYCEVLDAEDRPCRPGETGRLVFTSLHNYITPFVRYEIQDDVTLAPGPCPCVRGLPLWEHVEGRRHSLLHLPGGARKSSVGVALGVRQVGGVRQFQIRQRAVDHVLIRVVPDRTWSPAHAERMRQIVHAEAGPSVRVDVEARESLERPAGGKLKMVVIEMDEPAKE